VTNKSVPVTVVIPAHPARVQNGMLNRALASIEDQTVQPEHVIVKYYRKREGGDRTSQNG
jgi:hypothetical protein